MTDTIAAPAEPKGSISGFDLELIATSMASVAQALVQEHLKWNEGWSNWARMQLMNMQQIPTEAHLDYQGRQQAIVELLRRFQEPGEALARAGATGLKETIANYVDGFSRLLDSARSTMGAMQEDNDKTAAAIAGIHGKMHANMAAGKAR